MKLAMPIHDGNVSNVFDFASKLLLVDIKNGIEINRSEVALQSQLIHQRAGQLKNLGVNVLICGAISRQLASMVMTLGIKVLSPITGSIDNVLVAFIAGDLPEPQLTIPCSGKGMRKSYGRRQRACRRQGRRSE